ncbi:MAG: lipopolysaccharide heptosyltransferase I, partial [Caldimonas sp.]
MRVLIVRLSSLGDVVHAAPVLVDIARARPQARIDWVVEEAFAPLVGCFAGVERIVPMALRRWRRTVLASRTEMSDFWGALREREYDAVIDLQGLVKSAVVTRSARVAPGGRRFGLGNRTDGAAYEPLAKFSYDDAVVMPARIHVVDRSRRLAAAALGYVVDTPPQVPWQVPAAAVEDTAWADGRGVLLAHGSAKVVKLLPAAFWIRLGTALVAGGACVLLPWGTGDERERAVEIAAGIGDGARVVDRLPLGRLAAAISRLHGCIGLDTGITHVAATLGLP